MAGLPTQGVQQLPAVDRLSHVAGQVRPALFLLRQPFFRVGVALDFIVEGQHQLLQPPVIPAKAESVRQLLRSRRHIRIKFLQHPGQHPAAEQVRLALVQHPEVRRQPSPLAEVQQVDVLPEEGGTEGIDGLDIRLVNQEELPLEMAVTGMFRQALAQLLGDAAPELRRRRPGVGDNEEVVHIGFLLS